ncbi:MAG TPA: ATP-binding protein, partial [Clostridia bacterium]
ELPYVFEPFFSTKNSNLNMGLGLSYCYNVMQKHNGMLEVISAKGTGTTVLLKFPMQQKSSILNLIRRRVAYGENQGFNC